jgi:hypothetical protein
MHISLLCIEDILENCVIYISPSSSKLELHFPCTHECALHCKEKKPEKERSPKVRGKRIKASNGKPNTKLCHLIFFF